MSGDGGFTMMMGEFLTLVQAGLPGEGRGAEQRHARLRRNRNARVGFIDTAPS
jgi:hypothetical protein